MKKILLLILILPVIVQAADTELQDLAALVDIISTDVLYVVDDPDGAPLSRKITALNLFDMIDTSAELLAILTNETGTGALVFATSPTLVTPILGAITSGVGTALTALNGENIQNDTIDDDSIDWSDCTFDDFDFETNWKMWHSDAAGDVTEITLGADGTFLESNGPAANPAFRVLVDNDVPDTITIDLATLATTVTLADDDATNDAHDIVFTTDAAGPVNLEADIDDFYYNPSTGTVTATQFVGGGAGLTDTVTAYDDIADPDAASSITFQDGETVTWATQEDSAGSFFLIQNSDAALAANTYLLDLDYSVDDDEANADYLRCQDAGGVVFSIQENGDTVSTGTIQGTVLTASTSHIGPLLDAAGDEDMDYGSADVDDHTFITDGVGTGEIVLPAGSIDGTEILDDTIDSLDYAAGSIDDEHVADGALQEPAIDITNAGIGLDNYLLSYNHAASNFTWVVAGAGDMLTATYDAGISGGVDQITTVDSTYASDYVVLTGTAVGVGTPKTDGALMYDATSGTLNATEFVGGGVGLTGVTSSVLYHLIGNPTAAGSISFDDGETATYTGANDGAISFFTIQNSDANHTVGNMYLLDLDYSADDGDVDADFIKFQDSGSVVMTIQQDGEIATDGGLTAGGTVEGATLTEGGMAVINATQGGAWTGAHDFGGATSVEIPNAEDPDVDAAGEISNDTDGANETSDVIGRAFDGTNQFPAYQKVKTISIPVNNPDGLTAWAGRANPSQPVWLNSSGMTFTIIEVIAISDVDNYDCTLFESNTQTDVSDENDALIIALECDADGTEGYTDTEVVAHAVEHDHWIIFEDTLGDAGGVTVIIKGWFNADID